MRDIILNARGSQKAVCMRTLWINITDSNKLAIVRKYLCKECRAVWLYRLVNLVRLFLLHYFPAYYFDDTMYW